MLYFLQCLILFWSDNHKIDLLWTYFCAGAFDVTTQDSS